MNALQIHIRHFFNGNRPRHAAVRHVIVGHMQRAFIRKAVVRHDGKRMLAAFQPLHDRRKGGVGVVMFGDEHIVHIHFGGMAHALAFDADVPARRKRRLIPPFAAVEPEPGVSFPRARRVDGKAISRFIARKRSERPKPSGEFFLFSDAMRLECTDHIVPLLM